MQGATQTVHSTRPELRAAVPEDASAAVELIYLPMGKLADHLFGEDAPAKAREVLHELFEQSNNRFSYEFAEVLELNGTVGALLLSYPSNSLEDLSIPMAKQLRASIGWGGIFRLLKRSLPLLRAKETEPDEYYIYTVSVRPDYQRQGWGQTLLRRAEEKARAAGLSKCSLGVTLDNVQAKRFYERFNYEVVDTIRIPALEKAIGYPGYYRMLKPLNSGGSVETRLKCIE